MRMERRAVLAQYTYNISIIWTKTKATVIHVRTQCGSAIADTLNKFREGIQGTPLTSNQIHEECNLAIPAGQAGSRANDGHLI